MAGGRRPGPVCQAEEPVTVDDGTMCLAPTPAPGPNGLWTGAHPATAGGPVRISSADEPERAVQSASISLGAATSWESAVREVYNRGAAAIREQAREFVRTGQMTPEEARVWSNGQRNALMEACRDKSSPLGRAIAEAIKPKGKTVADLEALGKSAEGIIESAGKTNPYVNRVAVAFRYAGPAMLVVGITFSAYNIATSQEGEGWHVAAQEAGTWAGALAGGYVGGEGGCKAGALVGTFIQPGGGSAVGCVVGAVVGTIGGAVAGGYFGSKAGDYVYRSIDSSR